MANEKRLIDANALIDDAEMDGAIYACLAGMSDVRFLIESQPTVDAVEVVHGKWIEKIDMVESYLADSTEVFYECSVCECANIGESPYCPNCGAKMDGDGNG